MLQLDTLGQMFVTGNKVMKRNQKKYIRKEDKKENTLPKTFGLCIIVSKDKDLLMSCIEAEISY